MIEDDFILEAPLVHRDQRGWLAELIRFDGSVSELRRGGQFFITTALPRKVKGNHYHTRKREIFILLQGRAEMVMRPASGGEHLRIKMDATELTRVMTLPHYSHAVVNYEEQEAVFLVYIDECFDPQDSDTISDIVVNPETLELQ